MNNAYKETLWKQYGAAIDMLENAIVMCPERLWDTPEKFWYWSYHTLFYLDFYLTIDPVGFMPPAPFTLSELDPSGAMPERTYTKEELLAYLRHGRNKCHDVISRFTDEIAARRWKHGTMDFSMFEMLIYNTRHIQHHVAKLNMTLRQSIDSAPPWVSQTKASL